MAYSVDLRERVLANLEEESMRRTAKRFRMSLSSVYRIKRHYEETGQLKAKTPPPIRYLRTGLRYLRRRLPAINEQGEAWLRARIHQESDLTLATLCERYEQSQGRKVSKSAMDRTLKRMRISLKKRRSMTRNGKPSRFKRSVNSINGSSLSLTHNN
jgi:transposase